MSMYMVGAKMRKSCTLHIPILQAELHCPSLHGQLPAGFAVVLCKYRGSGVQDSIAFHRQETCRSGMAWGRLTHAGGSAHPECLLAGAGHEPTPKSYLSL